MEGTADLIIFNTNQNSSIVAVKVLLATYPKSRSLGRFFTTHI